MVKCTVRWNAGSCAQNQKKLFVWPQHFTQTCKACVYSAPYYRNNTHSKHDLTLLSTAVTWMWASRASSQHKWKGRRNTHRARRAHTHTPFIITQSHLLLQSCLFIPYPWTFHCAIWCLHNEARQGRWGSLDIRTLNYYLAASNGNEKIKQSDDIWDAYIKDLCHLNQSDSTFKTINT